MNDETVTVYELDELPDGTLRVGNSYECPVEEALMLVDQRKAKFPDASIGVVPERFV